jgi:hypothetical protein
MGDETVEVAERAINGLARDNVARSTEMLTKAGERIVSMEAEKVASALRITLADREAVPLDVLRADPELRELAVTPM